MPIAETLAVTLGPAIAKSLLKIYTKDLEIVQDASFAIIDILKSKTKEELAQKRGERIFTDIGERVAENLTPLFEDTQIKEDRQIIVTEHVKNTLENAKISSELLVKQKLEPSLLSKHLLESFPSDELGLSDKEIELYKKIIDSAAENIVDIASQLPNFTERSFAELLKGQEEIRRVVKRYLDEVERIREESIFANSESGAAQFEETYRLAVVRKLDELELFGAELTSSNRRYCLSVAYVTLSVVKHDVVKQEIYHGSNDSNDGSVDGEEKEESVVSVDEAFKDSRCIVIKGLAGSGKTTLLQWLGVQSAGKRFVDEFSEWNNNIPFFIRLREFVDSKLPPPEKFIHSVVPVIADTMPKGWVHEQLESGRAIVLIDGIDEVPEPNRSDVHTWIKDLAETYDQARFFVSSRPNAIKDDWLVKEGFKHVELQPMQLPDIYEFIEHWHSAVRGGLKDIEEINELEKFEKNLKKVIRENLPIRKLSTNPLLCAMICALHKERRQQLPSDRIELYEACCNMLIERRDIERRVDLSEYPKMNYRQKCVILEGLAYWIPALTLCSANLSGKSI